MNEAIKSSFKETFEEVKQAGQKVLALAKSSLPSKEAKLLVYKDNRIEVMQEFEVFY